MKKMLFLLLGTAFGAGLAGLVAQLDDRAPADRTSTFRTCADLFRLLAPRVNEDREFNELRVNPAELRDGTVFFSQKDKIVVRPFGVTDPYQTKILEAADAKKVLDALLRDAEARKREVTITGDVPFRRLQAQLREMGLGERGRWLMFSAKQLNPLAAGKRRLLDQEYTRIEVVVDIQLPGDQVEATLRSMTAGGADLPASTDHVKYIAARDLPGSGTIADRLLASRPPPGTLRVTVAHHSNGTAEFTDKSSLSIAKLGAKRIADGDMDVYVGCNLLPQNEGWLVISGEVALKEVALLGSRMADLLKGGRRRTGLDLLAEASILDQDGNGTGNGPPGGGGARGDGGEGKPRPSFRFLEVIGFGMALSFAAEAQAAGLPDDEDDEDGKKKDKTGGKKKGEGKKAARGGFLPGVLGTHASILRVGGRDRWFGTPDEAVAIHRRITPGALDRPTLYLDDMGKRVLLFEPSRGSGLDLPAPIAISPLADKTPAAQLDALRRQAARFWFYAGADRDPVGARKRLLGWQEQTGVTLPFVFLTEQGPPDSASWTLLSPFFRNTTHVGEALPRTQDEANKLGLYWCKAHETEAKLRQYGGLLDKLSGPDKPKRLDLRDDAQKELAELLADPKASAWFAGVWVDGGLRRPAGLLGNDQWVNPKACNAHITFLSAYPVSAPVDGRYYETTAHQVVAKYVPELHRAARDGKLFFQAEDQLKAFYKELRASGGTIAISSCGKYLIISE